MNALTLRYEQQEMMTIPVLSGRPLRVFLCYSWLDKPKVRELYERLHREGFAPWLDEQELIPGQDWQKEIAEAIRNCHVVIVCLSHNSVSKEGFVQKEIKWALDLADEKPQGTIYIIPTRLEEGVEVQSHLRKWQWVELFQEDGYQNLIKALKFKASKVGIHVTPSAAAASGSANPSSPTQTVPRVVVADDSDVSLLIVERFMRQQGFDVQTASDGSEAWNLLQQDVPTIAILDWRMPGIEGIEICRRIRSVRRRHYTYLFLITDNTKPGAVVEGLQAGADDYIKKPFDPEELGARLSIVQRIMNFHSPISPVGPESLASLS